MAENIKSTICKNVQYLCNLYKEICSYEKHIAKTFM